MSYDLDVLAGDVHADEAGWPPLDTGVARAALAALPGAVVAEDEVVWELDGAAVTFLLVPDDDGRLRSVGATVTDAVDADPAARRRDVRRILQVLLDVADRLGARVHDHQLGATVASADVDDVVEGFAGS